MCCVECASAVYKERHNTVFCHSAYGQVVFGVQCVGLNGVYINVFVQLYLNLSAVMANANVLVTAKVNSFTGSYFRCFTAIGGQIPALVCVICYFTNFLQLLFGCSLTFAVSKAIISSSCIAKSAYSCSSAIHNNVACCYTAACPDSAFAAADIHKSVIISGKENIVFQSHIIFHMAVFCLFRGYNNISTLGNNTVLACFFVYLIQLCYVYSIGICSTCSYVSNLTSKGITAYRYSTTVGSPSKAVCTFRSKSSNNTGFSISNGSATKCNRVLNVCLSITANCIGIISTRYTVKTHCISIISTRCTVKTHCICIITACISITANCIGKITFCFGKSTYSSRNSTPRSRLRTKSNREITGISPFSRMVFIPISINIYQIAHCHRVITSCICLCAYSSCSSTYMLDFRTNSNTVIFICYSLATNCNRIS